MLNNYHIHRLLYVLMVVGGVGSFALALAPADFAISHFVADDMFYYLTAARNVLEGHPASIDGASATNGFHPLWMVISIVVVAATNGDAESAFRVLLLVCAALFVATGSIMYKTVKDAAGSTPALIVGALFLCNYRLITLALCGQETALYGLSVAILLWWLSKRGERGISSARSAITLGLLLALTYGARLDALLLGAFVCLGVLAFNSGTVLRKRVVYALTAGITSLVPLIPWFIYSERSVGALLPRSGTAIQSFRDYRIDPSQSFLQNLPALIRTRVGGAIEPLNDLGNSLGYWPFIPSPEGSLRYLGMFVSLVVIGSVAFLSLRVGRFVTPATLRWIPAYAAAHLIFYGAFLLPSVRYLYPVIISMLVYLGIALQQMAQRTKQPQQCARTESAALRVGVVLIVVAAVAGVSAFQQGFGASRSHSVQAGLYRGVSTWLAKNTPTDSIVGSFNSGIVSYFSDRRVVNLDGVMNEGAIHAIQSKSLAQYVKDMRIGYLADVDSEITKFMDRFSGDPNWRDGWETAYKETFATQGGRKQSTVAVLRNLNVNARQ